MTRFKILEVDIKNFRGYKSRKFEFEKNDQLVILGGPNGYGKTSFIDAVEWCLTGDVRRITEEARARKEQNLAIMKKGLIQHKNAGRDPASVQIKFCINDKIVSIKRISLPNASSFTKEDTTVTISKSEEIYGDTIDEIFNGNISISESFYDHFICSQEKNLKFYEKGRKDLYNLFKLYLGSNSSVESIQEGLGGIIGVTEEKVQKLTTELEVIKRILEKESESEQIGDIVAQYNKLDTDFQLPDNTEPLLGLIKPIESRKLQLKNLISLNTALELNKGYIAHRDYRYLKNKYDRFKKEVYDVYPQNTQLVELVKGYDYEKTNEELNEINSFRVALKNMAPQLPTLEVLTNKICTANFLSNEQKNETKKSIEALKPLETEYKEIEQFLSNNKAESKLTEAVSTLIANAKSWYEYVDEKHECPLCRRPHLSLDELKNAITITSNAQDSKAKAISERIEKQKEILEDVKSAINNIIALLDSLTQGRKEFLVSIKNAFENLQEFITKCEAYGIKNDHIDLETLELCISNMHTEYEKHNGMKYIEYFDIDTVTLENKIAENEKIIQMSGIDTEVIESLNKNLESQKVEILDKIIVFIKHSENIKAKQKLEEDIKLLGNTISRINGIKTKISQAEGEYEANISKGLESIINAIYKKINRHTNFEELEIKRPETKATNIAVLIDSDTNFSNVMSTGQITSVALSFFIGLAIKENTSKFKAYFMDDPIQNLDDVNVLSFVDLLRSQLKSSKGFAEQLFISTCDEDFENLLKFKLKHFGIGVKQIKFIDYGNYIIDN